MSDQTVTAFVLPVEAAPTPEGVTFGGVPGVWVAGEPQHPAAFGLSVAEMRDLVADRGLPLEEVSVSAVDRVPAASTADIVSTPDALLRSDQSTVPGLTEDELAERDRFDAERRGSEIPATFTEDALAAVAPTPTLTEADALAARKERLTSLSVEELKALADDHEVAVPSGPKANLVEMLADAGVDTDPEAGE